jgi:AbrB family looped-hinge helix DNA binding protein
MKRTDMRVMGRCFGTAVLGPRGQLVIPVEARKELGINTGDKLLVFGHLGGRGLIFIRAAGLMRSWSLSSKAKRPLSGQRVGATQLDEAVEIHTALFVVRHRTIMSGLSKWRGVYKEK